MNSETHLSRATALMEQGRYELAEKELRQVLAFEPENPYAHALLAVTLLEMKQLDGAEHAAREAIGHGPDFDYSHYALARVLSERNRDEEAVSSIREAIQINPEDANYRAMLAGLEFDRKHWKESLEAAEQGLAMDPENVGCNNLRAMALVKLGRKNEAGATIGQTLSHAPENSMTHANMGWTRLNQGNRKAAMESFKESLRLDPNNDWAKSGLVEAIKAGNPVYAIMLRYFLWMESLSSQAQWGIILGGYIGNKILGNMATENPALAPWIWPLRIVYIIFAVFTWLAHPIFNLMLFLHPMGKHALNRDQRNQAKLVGLCFAASLILTTGTFVLEGGARFILPAIAIGVCAIPVATVFSCQRGWPRNAMAAIASVLVALALGIGAISVIGPPEDSVLFAIRSMISGILFLGVFAGLWIGNVLVHQRPKK